MKQIIFNADDFGMSKEINEGIKQGIKSGVINNVSIMVNMPYFDKAIAYLKKHPDVTVGLHFNLTEGAPLSPPYKVSTLIREDGNFYHWTHLVINLFKRSTSLEEIAYELNMQYQKLYKTGIKMSYLDSHHHIHLYPSIFKLFLNFALKHKIKSLRGRTFKLTFPLFSGTIPSAKQLLITSLCLIDNFIFSDQKHFFEIDHLFDINWHPEMSKQDFLKLLDNMADDKTQIICHPAILSKTGNLKFLKPRQKELSLFLDKDVQKKIALYNHKTNSLKSYVSNNNESNLGTN